MQGPDLVNARNSLHVDSYQVLAGNRRNCRARHGREISASYRAELEEQAQFKKQARVLHFVFVARALFLHRLSLGS